MATKINRWSPDTCGCVMEYSWDDSLPQEQIVISPTTTVSRCPAHTSLSTPANHFNVLMDENPRKNQAHQHILDNGPSTLYDIVDGTKRLKNGMAINWSWTGTSPNRVLTLTVTGITLNSTQKTAIQSVLNTKFGAGKVLLA